MMRLVFHLNRLRVCRSPRLTLRRVDGRLFLDCFYFWSSPVTFGHVWSRVVIFSHVLPTIRTGVARNKFKVAKSDRPKIERPTGNRPVLDRFVAMRDSLKWRRSPSDSDFQVSAFRFQVGARPKGLALRKEWLVLLALARAARTMVKNEKR
jgi:hypothetical protein